MRAYLERAKEHDEFMKIQDEEFRIGKRHLANMMGEDPETFTQEDIDVSNRSNSGKSNEIETFPLHTECHRLSLSVRFVRSPSKAIYETTRRSVPATESC